MIKERQCHFYRSSKIPLYSPIISGRRCLPCLSGGSAHSRILSQTEMTWIVGKTEMGLLSSIPNITLIPYVKKRDGRRFITLETTKNKQFDALLNMQTAFRASLLFFRN